jgi:hypothetical protein
MTKSDQKGFISLQTFLIAMVLAVIGGAGYLVYQAQKTTKSTLDSATTLSDNIESGKKSADYLEIKEWDVKIALSSESEGAYYQVSEPPAGSPDKGVFIDVSSSKTDAIAGPAGNSCKGEYIAILTRMKKDDPRWDDPQYSGAVKAQKEIGDYKFTASTLKQYVPECFQKIAGDFTPDQTTSDKFKKIADAFVEDFKTLQAN